MDRKMAMSGQLVEQATAEFENFGFGDARSYLLEIMGALAVQYSALAAARAAHAAAVRESMDATAVALEMVA